MKEAVMQTLHQYFTHQFNDGNEILLNLPELLEKHVEEDQLNLVNDEHVADLAKYVSDLGMNISSFCLNAFTGVICDIYFQSGQRKHKASFHDWLFLLFSKIIIDTKAVTPKSTQCQGDMNKYTLTCAICGEEIGMTNDLLSVLGGAASAIMDHFGFGLDWKELFSMTTENFQ